MIDKWLFWAVITILYVIISDFLKKTKAAVETCLIKREMAILVNYIINFCF